MVGERRWGLKVAGFLTVAVLVGVGGWQGYERFLGEAQALDGRLFEVPHFKCYVITPGTALNEPVRLGDQFHPITPDGSALVPSTEGGESVVIRAPQLVWTPVAAKCRTRDGTER